MYSSKKYLKITIGREDMPNVVAGIGPADGSVTRRHRGDHIRENIRKYSGPTLQIEMGLKCGAVIPYDAFWSS